MEKKAIEFRNVQKKQISRFKEKNPIEGLNLVLQYSFNSFLILIDKAEVLQRNLKAETHKLLVSMLCMKKLIALRFGISEEMEQEINGMIVDDEMDV